MRSGQNIVIFCILRIKTAFSLKSFFTSYVWVKLFSIHPPHPPPGISLFCGLSRPFASLFRLVENCNFMPFLGKKGIKIYCPALFSPKFSLSRPLTSHPSEPQTPGMDGGGWIENNLTDTLQNVNYKLHLLCKGKNCQNGPKRDSTVRSEPFIFISK